MQLCSLGGGDSSLGGSQHQQPAPPLVCFASPSTRAKLHALERRLTGGGPSTAEQPPPGMGHAGGSSRTAPDDHDPDVQLCAVVDAPGPAQQQLAQQQAEASGSGFAITSASKRRKTAKPQHRPLSGAVAEAGAAAAQHDSRATSATAAAAATAGAAAGAAAGQRDKAPPRSRASPRGAERGPSGSGGGADGGSNPPTSPVMLGGATGHHSARTPRSSSKQQHQQQHSRGQTNINKFFPLLPTDGSSRDSDTPSAAALQQQLALAQAQQQQRQQQQQPQPLPQLTPIEEVCLSLPTQPQQQQLQQPQQQAALAASGSGGAAAGAKQRGGKGSRSSGGGSSVAALQQQLAALEQKHQHQLEQLRQQARQREGELSEQLAASLREVEQLNSRLAPLQQELAAAKSASEERESTVRTAVASLVSQLAAADGSLSRLQLSLSGSRLGTLGIARTGALGFTEVWEDGPALRELAARQASLARSREEVEAARKALKRRLPPPPRAGAPPAAADAATAGGLDSSSSGSSSSSQYISSAEYVMQDEIFKVRLSVLKRDEEQLAREDERLQAEKMKHLRLLKRVRDEDASRFCGCPTLNRRYVLLQLLGRGGFSEVHKAYDLATLQFVAVKVHQLNSGWSEARKASYVRHAVREYTIHKALRHPNIVTLSDIFEVDNATFATVLELCAGGDLEAHLQQHHVLPEREALALIAQVFSGLAYLNRGSDSGQRVIHFDLKPANILFDTLGTVKITDFGLSKVVEEGHTQGMELTSQGAGTYWYLPPECFQTSGSHSAGAGAARPAAGGGLLPAGLLAGGRGGPPPHGAPLISNKVDVWSAGVILFQMLYGRRPFGEGLSQEQIYRDGVMLNARQVQFPAKPAVSAEGRAFMSRCLTYDQAQRWDVLTAAADPYLQLRR